MQGGLDEQLAEEALGADRICDLVGFSSIAFTEQQLLLEELSALLQLPLTGGALLAVFSKCTEISNDASLGASSPEAPTTLLQEISAGQPNVNITNVMFMHTRMNNSLSHSRQLAAKSKGRTKGSSEELTSIVQSADVSEQEWTVSDLPVQYAPVRGTVLRPRMLGRGNEMLGGMKVKQIRAADSNRKCSSRFSQLVSACQRSQLQATSSQLSENSRVLGTSRLRPFGRDPAFNPLSGLFSATAAQNEEQYYNTSVGSEEVSEEGFPAAFFPRVVKGKPTFVIVFPVRPCLFYASLAVSVTLYMHHISALALGTQFFVSEPGRVIQHLDGHNKVLTLA